MTDETTTRRAPTLADLRARREEILALAERYGASNVRVFGSVARGDATPDSDIDLLVSAKRGAGLGIIAFWLDLQELLGYSVSLITDGVQDARFITTIQRDAVPL